MWVRGVKHTLLISRGGTTAVGRAMVWRAQAMAASPTTQAGQRPKNPAPPHSSSHGAKHVLSVQRNVVAHVDHLVCRSCGGDCANVEGAVVRDDGASIEQHGLGQPAEFADRRRRVDAVPSTLLRRDSMNFKSAARNFDASGQSQNLVRPSRDSAVLDQNPGHLTNDGRSQSYRFRIKDDDRWVSDRHAQWWP